MNDPDLNLFNPEPSGAALRDRGMTRAADAAGADFATAGGIVIGHLAALPAPFCSDEFWARMQIEFPQYAAVVNGRLVYGDASGSVFQQAIRWGVIQRTGRRVRLARPEAHAKDAPEYVGGDVKLCPTCKGSGRA